MGIPDYQSTMLPLLKFFAGQQEHSLREAKEGLVRAFKLSEEQRKKLLPSGTNRIFSNRVGWAAQYLKKAGLLKSIRTGFYEITQRGLEVLKQNPAKIDNKFLGQYPEFMEFRGVSKKR